MHTMVGAVGHIAAEMLISVDDEVARLTQTLNQFQDQEVVMKDPGRKLQKFWQLSEVVYRINCLLSI